MKIDWFLDIAIVLLGLLYVYIFATTYDKLPAPIIANLVVIFGLTLTVWARYNL